MLHHPLPLGTRIVSVPGEWDQDDDCTERHTGPRAEGGITSVDWYPRQGWTYGVVFEASDVWVFLEEQELNGSDYIVKLCAPAPAGRAL